MAAHPSLAEETKYAIVGAPWLGSVPFCCPWTKTSCPWDPWQSFIVSCLFKGATPLPQSPVLAFSSLNLPSHAIRGQ